MAVPHSGIPVADPAPQDATVDDLTAATLTVAGASTLASVTATGLSAPLAGELGGTTDAATVDALHGGSTHAATQSAAEATAAAALSAHAADTTAIHGIVDTSALATDADLAAHEADTSNVHGIVDTTVLATDADLAAHSADTTDIHGIADTSVLATDSDVSSAVAAHAAAADPHAGYVLESAHTLAAHDALGLASKAAYSAWTPALTATTTSPTLGSGSSAQGRYFQNGKHVVAYGSINFGTSGTAAGTGDYQISLPVTARTRVNNDMNMIGQGYLFDSSVSALRPCIFIYVDTGKVGIRLTTDGSLVTAAAPWAWAASDVLIFHFDYEAA